MGCGQDALENACRFQGWSSQQQPHGCKPGPVRAGQTLKSVPGLSYNSCVADGALVCQGGLHFPREGRSGPQGSQQEVDGGTE